MKYFYLKLNESSLREILCDCVAEYSMIFCSICQYHLELYFNSNREFSLNSISIFLNEDNDFEDDDIEKMIGENRSILEIEKTCKEKKLYYIKSVLNQEIVYTLLMQQILKIKNNGLPKKVLINHKIDFYGDFGVDLSCIILLSDDDILDNMCYDVKQNKGYTNDFKFIRINNAV